MNASLNSILADLDAIGLDDLNKRAAMLTRVDRKYALDAARSAADAAAATRLPGPSGKTGRVLASDGANVVWKLPVFPVDGATQGTLSRDAQGRLTGASLKLDDKPLVYAMQRDAQGRLQQVSATYDGYKRAVNLSRDAQGRLTSFTGEKTHV